MSETNLKSKREELLVKLKKVDEQIAGLPETIAEVFSHLEGVDVSSLGVTFVQPVLGSATDHYDESQGFRFRLEGDENIYLVSLTFHSTEGNSLRTLAIKGDHKSSELVISDLLKGANELNQLLIDQLLLAEDRHVAIAMLLLLKIESGSEVVCDYSSESLYG